MILLRNKNDNTKSLLVGVNEDDHKVLQFIFDNHIMWGFHTFVHINDKNKDDMLVKQMLARHPEAVCIAQLTCPEGFVPKYDKQEINK